MADTKKQEALSHKNKPTFFAPRLENSVNKSLQTKDDSERNPVERVSVNLNLYNCIRL